MVHQRIRQTLNVVGSFLKYLAFLNFVPLVASIHYGEEWGIFASPWAIPSTPCIIYLFSGVIVFALGAFLERRFKSPEAIGRASGFTIVSFTWLCVALLGTIPYLFFGIGFIDAFFESMSGFTTTGATILPVVEALPRSLLLWRSLTQWLGGMGVIVLFVAVMPKLGVGGSQLFDREFPGPMPERLRPRIGITARVLWSIYAGFTAVEGLALHFWAGLPTLDSICISLCTMSTGGFTPLSAGIGFYANPLAESIIIVFMFMAGTNFLLFLHLRRKEFILARDEEFRLYAIIMAVAAGVLALSQQPGLWRDGLFQTVSIMTTTGFTTCNFAAWPFGPKMLLLALMFIGGCGGSTAGGVKVIRARMLWKHTIAMMKRAISPKAVIPAKYNGEVLPHEIMQDIISFVFLYVLVLSGAVVVLSFMGLDFETAISAVAATLGNVGPGLGMVGPDMSYAWIGSAGKIVLTFCMWVGRLELFTAFMVFMPYFWKK